MGNCSGLKKNPDDDIDPYSANILAEQSYSGNIHLVRGSSLNYDSVSRILSNDSVNTNGSGGKNDFMGISVKKYDEFLKRQLNSNIYLEV